MADIHDDSRDPKSKNKLASNKSVDVTKPRTQSNIDASRVSAYTLREQQSLDKLARQMGTDNRKDDKKSRNRSIIVILLILLLLLLSILFVIFLGRQTPTEEALYDMRLSMQMENKSAFTVITETGQEVLREISPGDKIPVRAVMRNANNIDGDVVGQGETAPAIYVRFKLVLVLDYEERYDIVDPVVGDRWYKYDEFIEQQITGGMQSDDHYYYYLGSIAFMETQELFSELHFVGENITCDDGGKYGQLQITVEAVEANLGNIISRAVWETAPQAWINRMANGQY